MLVQELHKLQSKKNIMHIEGILRNEQKREEREKKKILIN